MLDQFSKRYPFNGTPQPGVIPGGGVRATPSLKAAGYRSPKDNGEFSNSKEANQWVEAVYRGV